MRLDCVMFEIEGILLETARARELAMAEAVRASRLDVPTPALQAALDEAGSLGFEAVGEALVRHAYGAIDATDAALLALRASRELSSTLSAGATLVPGARKSLIALSSRVRLGVVTRTTRAVADLVLGLAELETAMVLAAGDDHVTPKPSPRPYELALSRLPRRGNAGRPVVVAIEDGPIGVRAAISAGVPCVAVASGAAAVAVERLATTVVPSLDILTWEMLAALASETVEAAG